MYAEARARYESAQEKLPQGRAAILPTLSLTGTSYSQDRKVLDPESPGIHYPSRQYGLALSQPLFRWQNWLQYHQGGLQVAQAEAEFSHARQDLILRVTQAYFDVLLAEETVRLLNAQKSAIDEQLARAKAYFEAGTVTVTDTHEAQSRHDLTSAQLIAANSDLAVKRAALQMLMGNVVDALVPLKASSALIQPDPSEMEPWVKAAETQSPQVQMRAAGAEIAQYEASKQQAGHLPTVDLVASVTHAHDLTFVSSGFGVADVGQRTVGIQLSIPLFQGGQTSSRAREAAAQHMAALASLESARRQAAQIARQTYLGVVNGLAQIKALEAAQTSSELALDASKVGYEVGVRVGLDVLNAEQQLQNTRRDLVKARLDTLLAQLRLKAAVGTLNEADLQMLADRFGP